MNRRVVEEVIAAFIVLPHPQNLIISQQSKSSVNLSYLPTDSLFYVFRLLEALGEHFLDNGTYEFVSMSIKNDPKYYNRIMDWVPVYLLGGPASNKQKRLWLASAIRLFKTFPSVDKIGPINPKILTYLTNVTTPKLIVPSEKHKKSNENKALAFANNFSTLQSWFKDISRVERQAVIVKLDRIWTFVVTGTTDGYKSADFKAKAIKFAEYAERELILTSKSKYEYNDAATYREKLIDFKTIPKDLHSEYLICYNKSDIAKITDLMSKQTDDGSHYQCKALSDVIPSSSNRNRGSNLSEIVSSQSSTLMPPQWKVGLLPEFRSSIITQITYQLRSFESQGFIEFPTINSNYAPAVSAQCIEKSHLDNCTVYEEYVNSNTILMMVLTTLLLWKNSSFCKVLKPNELQSELNKLNNLRYDKFQYSCIPASVLSPAISVHNGINTTVSKIIADSSAICRQGSSPPGEYVCPNTASTSVATSTNSCNLSSEVLNSEITVPVASHDSQKLQLDGSFYLSNNSNNLLSEITENVGSVFNSFSCDTKDSVTLEAKSPLASKSTVNVSTKSSAANMSTSNVEVINLLNVDFDENEYLNAQLTTDNSNNFRGDTVINFVADSPDALPVQNMSSTKSSVISTKSNNSYKFSSKTIKGKWNNILYENDRRIIAVAIREYVESFLEINGLPFNLLFKSQEEFKSLVLSIEISHIQSSGNRDDFLSIKHTITSVNKFMKEKVLSLKIEDILSAKKQTLLTALASLCHCNHTNTNSGNIIDQEDLQVRCITELDVMTMRNFDKFIKSPSVLLESEVDPMNGPSLDTKSSKELKVSSSSHVPVKINASNTLVSKAFKDISNSYDPPASKNMTVRPYESNNKSNNMGYENYKDKYITSQSGWYHVLNQDHRTKVMNEIRSYIQLFLEVNNIPLEFITSPTRSINSLIQEVENSHLLICSNVADYFNMSNIVKSVNDYWLKLLKTMNLNSLRNNYHITKLSKYALMFPTTSNSFLINKNDVKIRGITVADVNILQTRYSEYLRDSSRNYASTLHRSNLVSSDYTKSYQGINKINDISYRTKSSNNSGVKKVVNTALGRTVSNERGLKVAPTKIPALFQLNSSMKRFCEINTRKFLTTILHDKGIMLSTAVTLLLLQEIHSHMVSSCKSINEFLDVRLIEQKVKDYVLSPHANDKTKADSIDQLVNDSTIADIRQSSFDKEHSKSIEVIVNSASTDMVSSAMNEISCVNVLASPLNPSSIIEPDSSSMEKSSENILASTLNPSSVKEPDANTIEKSNNNNQFTLNGNNKNLMGWKRIVSTEIRAGILRELKLFSSRLFDQGRLLQAISTTQLQQLEIKLLLKASTLEEFRNNQTLEVRFLAILSKLYPELLSDTSKSGTQDDELTTSDDFLTDIKRTNMRVNAESLKSAIDDDSKKLSNSSNSQSTNDLSFSNKRKSLDVDNNVDVIAKYPRTSVKQDDLKIDMTNSNEMNLNSGKSSVKWQHSVPNSTRTGMMNKMKSILHQWHSQHRLHQEVNDSMIQKLEMKLLVKSLSLEAYLNVDNLESRLMKLIAKLYPEIEILPFS